MSSDEVAIKVENLSKCFEIYETPRDRLKQFVLPRFQRLLDMQSKKYFREFWALKDVSFEVKKGETIGIIGRNGSGKSTLLQMICGTLSPTSGTVKTNGRIAALLELGSGFNPEFTGRENVYMNGALLGLSKDEIDSKFDDIAAFADIGDFIEQPVKSYSSGMVVRLAFAVAINVDPQILVVDEALSVGDELFQRKCFSRIESLKKKGATILFVSHSGSAIVELCDSAVLVDKGEMLILGEPKAIVGYYQKLLYSPVDMREDIRNQIQQKKADMDAATHATGVPVYNNFAEQESLDPHFKPNSTIEYESLGPVIGEVKILTLDGREVNGLVRGRQYRFCYRVFFEKAAESVRFGMLIKTTSGIALGGALSASSSSEAISYVGLGDEICVEFTFNCYLNPGTYFVNCGIFGIANVEETVLHRKSDVAAFRVLPITPNKSTEIIDFGFQSLVRFNEQTF